MTQAKTIRPMQVDTRPAADVKPGDITLDGIVLDVVVERRGARTVTIRHRSVTYLQDIDSTVQVYARIGPDMLAVLAEAVDAEEAHR